MLGPRCKYLAFNHTCFLPALLRQVLASEGPAALAIGLAPTLWRNCVWNALFYGTMWEIERRMAPLDGGGPLDLCRTALIGTAVGAASCVFNIPFDVVKSR